MKEKISKNKNLIILIGAGVLFVVLLIIILIFGTSKKVVCTSKSDQSKNGYVLETKYEITARGKEVDTVKITEVITSKKSDVLTKFEKQFKDQYEYNKKTYGGYSYKVVKSKSNVVSNVTIDYGRFDMKKFIKNNEAMKKYTKDNKFLLDGAKELYESTGATCK